MSETIDELRRLLKVPDRSHISFVMLSDTVETTQYEDSFRSFRQGEDRAIVIVGPAHLLAVRRTINPDGSILYAISLRPEMLG